MATRTPRTQFIDELSKVSRKMRTLFDARINEHGLTLARARTLLSIARGQAVNQKELAEELEIENATLVRLIDGLEKQGLIERRAVDGDRRAKHVAMTRDGETLAEIVNMMALQLGHDVLAGVDEAEMKIARKVFAQMALNIENAG